MTDQPPTSQARDDESQDTAKIPGPPTEDLVVLGEGFCPFCYTQLHPLTEAETDIAATWAHPPCGYCPRCNGYAGKYTDDSGTFLGYGELTPYVPGSAVTD